MLKIVENLFRYFVTPNHSPETEYYSGLTDYSQQENWASWPGRDSPAENTSENSEAIPESDRLADVFYVYPTLWMSGKSWNSPLVDQSHNVDVDGLLIGLQASAFNKAGRIFVPRYQQATVVATACQEKHFPVLDRAYQDVKAAFYYFLENRDGQRPVILAGHSQGSFHLLRLLIDEVVNSPVMNQLVAVYAVGCWTPKKLFDSDGPLSPLAIGQTPLQTRCFLSWDTFLAGGDPEAMDLEVPHWNGHEYYSIPYEQLDAVEVNPVSWTLSGESTIAQHKGAVTSGYSSMRQLRRSPNIQRKRQLPPAVSRLIRARAGHNGLFINKFREPSVKYNLLKGKSLHMSDYSLFYHDIRENAYLRAKEFVKNDG